MWPLPLVPGTQEHITRDFPPPHENTPDIKASQGVKRGIVKTPGASQEAGSVTKVTSSDRNKMIVWGRHMGDGHEYSLE